MSPSRRGRRQPLHVVAGIGACVIFIFASAMALSFHLPAIVGWDEQPALDPAAPIEIAALGKTPAQLNRLHGDLSVSLGPQGDKTATFTTPAGLHTVWFAGRRGAERAFLVRLDRRMRSTSQQDVNADLVKWFGKPTETTCPTVTRDACRFSWSYGESVTVRAESAGAAPTSEREVDVTMVAIDTRMRDAAAAGLARKTDDRPRSGADPLRPACTGQKRTNDVFYTLVCGRIALRD